MSLAEINSEKGDRVRNDSVFFVAEVRRTLSCLQERFVENRKKMNQNNKMSLFLS